MDWIEPAIKFHAGRHNVEELEEYSVRWLQVQRSGPPFPMRSITAWSTTWSALVWISQTTTERYNTHQMPSNINQTLWKWLTFNLVQIIQIFIFFTEQPEYNYSLRCWLYYWLDSAIFKLIFIEILDVIWNTLHSMNYLFNFIPVLDQSFIQWSSLERIIALFAILD